MSKEKLLINNPKRNNSEVMSNKQIEEMACENCLHHFACLTNSEYVPTPCPAYEDKAEYRKQSEGEWVDRYNGKYANPIYVCSLCGKGTLLKPHIDDLGNMVMIQALSSFCPNCGASMRRDKTNE